MKEREESDHCRGWVERGLLGGREEGGGSGGLRGAVRKWEMEEGSRGGAPEGAVQGPPSQAGRSLTEDKRKRGKARPKANPGDSRTQKAEAGGWSRPAWAI